jgi:CRISPR/Cas system-associated protein Csm6
MITHHWLDISNHECLIESDTPHSRMAARMVSGSLCLSR